MKHCIDIVADNDGLTLYRGMMKLQDSVFSYVTLTLIFSLMNLYVRLSIAMVLCKYVEWQVKR